MRKVKSIAVIAVVLLCWVSSLHAAEPARLPLYEAKKGDVQIALAHAQDFDEIKRKAEAGDARAQYQLGWMYSIGHGVILSDIETVKWWRLAAEQGNAMAQYGLGHMYFYGKGISQSTTEALRWWRLAAEAGNAEAQYDLGYMYQNGNGVSKNDEEAVKWYRMAAKQKGWVGWHAREALIGMKK